MVFLNGNMPVCIFSCKRETVNNYIADKASDIKPQDRYINKLWEAMEYCGNPDVVVISLVCIFSKYFVLKIQKSTSLSDVIPPLTSAFCNVMMYVLKTIFLVESQYVSMISRCQYNATRIKFQFVRICHISYLERVCVQYQIEAETKWSLFSRRHFQMYFHEWKYMNFD